MKTLTTIYIDSQIKAMAKQRQINISQLTELALRNRLDMPIENDIAKISLIELEEQIAITKTTVNELEIKKQKVEELIAKKEAKRLADIEAKKPKVLKRFDL